MNAPSCIFWWALCLTYSVSLSQGIFKPYRIYWNYFDNKCINRNIDLNLDAYGIEHNDNGFIGDKVAIFYGSKIGKWPFYNQNNVSDPVNGGLPQLNDLDAHLNAIAAAIRDFTSHNGTGLGIFDQELWVPIFHANREATAVYVEQSLALVTKKYPQLSEEVRMQLAEDFFTAATKNLMTSTLALARAMRPKMTWGYYLYPRFWKSEFNDQLKWLWQETTGYFPSIYIKRRAPRNSISTRIQGILSETLRSRAEHGRRDDPILVYTNVQHEGMGFFTQAYLDLSVRLPIEMGADGLVLWTSSNFFKDDPRLRCLQLKRFISTKLGPYLQNLNATMTNCSLQLCKGQGRCVRKEYAQNVPYSLTKGPQKRDVSSSTLQEGDKISEVTMDKRSAADNNWDDFACQCFKGWKGNVCDVPL